MDVLAKNCHRKTVERLESNRPPPDSAAIIFASLALRRSFARRCVLSIRFAKRLLQLRAEGSLVLCRHL